MLRSTRAVIVCSAVVALAVTGCGGTKSATAPASSSTTDATTTTASTTATPSASPTPSVTPKASPPVAKPSPLPRTAAALSRALLVLKDLPTGFQVEPADSSAAGGAVTASSKDPKCARLIALTNADLPPGAVAAADRSLSGGQDDPFIDEDLAAMRTDAAAKSYLRTYRAAATACRTLTLKMAGEGSSKMTISEVSAPPSGDDTFATRYTATGGALDGLEITTVTSRVTDVLVAMTFVAAGPDDVEGATGLAVDKLREAFGPGSES